MKCPNCPDSSLSMTDRQGIEIDFCPKCRGVWLDRGELDKLLERAVTAAPPLASNDRSQRDFQDSDHRPSSGTSARRKKSWMSDIFD